MCNDNVYPVNIFAHPVCGIVASMTEQTKFNINTGLIGYGSCPSAFTSKWCRAKSLTLQMEKCIQKWRRKECFVVVGQLRLNRYKYCVARARWGRPSLKMTVSQSSSQRYWFTLIIIPIPLTFSQVQSFPAGSVSGSFVNGHSYRIVKGDQLKFLV